MKLNGWVQVVVLLMGMMGLVTWVITADNRLHSRCDSLETTQDSHYTHHVDKENKIEVKLAEIEGDIKEIHTILRLTFPREAKKAKELNGNN